MKAEESTGGFLCSYLGFWAESLEFSLIKIKEPAPQAQEKLLMVSASFYIFPGTSLLFLHINGNERLLELRAS